MKKKTSTSNTSKLKPRRMWADKLIFSEKGLYLTASESEWSDGDPIPVIVIPLDDVEGLVDKGAWAMRQSLTLDDTTYIEAFRAGLKSIGIAIKKGGDK